MTELAAAGAVRPPWNSSGFFSEADLKEAQEYYFQTHATHSRMVAEGRNAQGFMKSMVRKKLTQQMGEDFRMYTGSAIGENQDGESQGIRGELNYLLRHVYQRIAPNQEITSPTQEDLTILKHPHGALEVCYGMTCYYTTLLKRHATLAGNRRKVLKSILDEEMFKWVWRMALGFLLSDPATKVQWADSYLTLGLPYVPADRQRAPLAVKLLDLGQFLLGKAIGESHLRFPLCYYFVTYIRNVQTALLMQPGPQDLDQTYLELTQRSAETPVDNLLIAVDVLMNSYGNSGQSFDDIFKAEEDLQKYIPAQEIDFIQQFDPFSTGERMAATLRAVIPNFQREDITEQGKASLLPLLFMLRTIVTERRNQLLEKMPIPVMVMLRARMSSGPQDEVAKVMLSTIVKTMEERQKKGESYQVRAVNRAGMAGVATVGTPPPKAEAPPAASSAPAPKTAPRPAAAAPAVASAAPAPKPAAAPKPEPAPAAPRTEPAPAAAAPAPAAGEGLLETRLLIAWRMDGDHLDVRTLAAKDIAALSGREPTMYVPWVLLALQTGQVFPAVPQASKDVLEKLVGAVIGRIPADLKPRLPAGAAQALGAQSKTLSPQKFLLALIAKANLGEGARSAGALGAPLASLNEKFKANLPDFLRNPSKDDYREQRVNLSAPEKAAVSILQKVARLQ